VSDTPPPPLKVKRHALATRLWHWLNALSIFILLGSGLMIFNAHPNLYWGEYGANFDTPWLSLPRWPGWLTIPTTYNLALGRRWHLFFALVFAFALLGYMIASLVNRHFTRDLRFRREELTARHIRHDIAEHLAFRFHDPTHPARYNVLQKGSYVIVLFVLLPLVILSGLTLSPGMNAAWPWLLDLFGGRQSARSVHFIAMAAITGFTILHLTLVILAGAWNEVRSMITGWWRAPQ
jgi:thiosulfate reductase cytochrome b subunit